MTPADYLRVVVLPTLAEFVAEPTDQRRAYLACITVAHTIDHIDVSLGSSSGGKHTIRKTVRAVESRSAVCLDIVEAVSNGTKHAQPDPRASQLVKFAPGHEQYAPPPAFDTLGDGFDEGRWDRPGLVVAHKADETLGLGSYFIDDCAWVVVRSCATAFPNLFASIDLSLVASDLDRAAWISIWRSVWFSDSSKDAT